MEKNNIIKIGNVKIKKTAALAPMAGVTDRAFREISKEYGASYVVTEMVSAKALCFGDKKTHKLLDFSRDERPIAIQIFGEDPVYLAKAADIVMKYAPDIIDINMGCPVKKITANNSGSALMKDPRLIGEIVKAVSQAASIPVTIKIRSGWDEDNINAVEVAKIAEESGAAAITIHGRTRQQMYLPSASLDIIKRVKDAVKIPVIGNGDVSDFQSAKKMYEETGCDLVMVGRGALGNPFIFREISDGLSGKEEWQNPSLEERVMVMKKHIGLMIKYSTEDIAIKEARKHVGWYLKGFHNAAIVRNEVSVMKSFEDLNRILERYIGVF